MRLLDPRSSNAVLIGASTYQSDALPDVPAVRNNLVGLFEVLTDPAIGGLAPERCAIVSDWVGVRGVHRILQGHARSAQDTLIVYYAGHGLAGPLRNELYLALTDTDPDELPVSALASEVIRDLFVESQALNRILILDCCFSGRAVEGFLASPAEAVLGQTEIAGTYTLAATSANSAAIAPPGATYTAFTGELLSVLRNGIPGEPGLLTLGAIYRQLRRRLPARGMPVPHQRGADTAVQLALARNVSHRWDPADAPTGPIPVQPPANVPMVRPARGITSRKTIPFAVNVALIVCVVITLIIDAIVLVIILRPEHVAAQAPPAAPTTTLPIPISPPSNTTAMPVPGALVVATSWAMAWVYHPPGITNAQWLGGLRPYTTEEQIGVMSSVDPANIPATALTGPVVAKSSLANSVEVTVQTNGGTLSMTVIKTSDGWRVAHYEQAS